MTAEDQMPDRLGPYCLLERIGEGGMGVVFMARGADGQMVALKVLRSVVAEDPMGRRRLAREVETMRRVRSPYVAAVIDADLAGDTPYIVTRYVPGQTLEEVVTVDGPLPPRALLRLAYGLADALMAVHAAGVVHRDLKPSNVMLLGELPVVIDFGIAQGPEATRLTMTGMFMGTPGYLAPEVIEGQPSSEASDIHAWGATVAFAATGRSPFGSGAYEAIFYKIVNGQADLAGIPSSLLPLVVAALARDPRRRPTGAQLSAQAAALDPDALARRAAAGGRAAGGPFTAVPATSADVAHGASAQDGLGPAMAGGDAGLAGVPGVVLGPADPGAAAGVVLGPADSGAAAGVVLGPATFEGAAGVVPGPVDPAGTGAVANQADPAAGFPSANGVGAAGPGLKGPGTNGPGLKGPGLKGPGTNPMMVRRPGLADFADMLPPVQYGPGPGPRPRPGPHTPRGPARPPAKNPFAPRPPRTGAAKKARWPSAMVVATLVVGVGISVILPVVGALGVLALIVALRAGDVARERAVERRAARGAQRGDQVLVAAMFPWYLVRSLLSCLLLAPFALAAGVVAGGVAIAVTPGHHLPRAVAVAAGTIVAFYGFGPGSARPRRQLNRFFAAVATTSAVQAVALAGITALALATLAAAASWPSLYWPAGAPGGVWHFGMAHVGPVRHLGLVGRLLLSHLRGG
ncbi:MAG TPA: protein kinase [Streptosporangiaceae bacterium]|nr:protein kinase [Streptosporangiaceae bacterium]